MLPAVLIFALAACLLASPSCKNRGSESKSGGRQIVDMTGRAVAIPLEVRRVASNGGAIDEWLLLLGARNKIVGASRWTQANAWFVRIFPGTKKLPAFVDESIIDLEKMAAARPDVLLAFSGLEIQQKLVESGVPVVLLERRNHEELKRAIRMAGNVLGPREEHIAANFCDYFDANIRRVSSRTASLPPNRRLRVYRGGGADGFVTEGKDTLVTAWIETAGGINVAAEAGIEGMNRRVSPEQILLWNPDAIIVTDTHARQAMQNDRRLKGVSAVRKNHIYVNPKGVYQWSTRSAEEALQILWAAKILHPELFIDLNLEQEIRDFYRVYFQYELSSEEISRIINGLPPPET